MKNTKHMLTIAGIPVELQRKNIKNLHLYVLPPDGRVRISAPMRLSVERITEFVLPKLDWIRDRQKKLSEHPYAPEPKYESGETIVLFGVPYLLSVESGSGKSRMILEDRRAILTVRPDSTFEQRKTVVNEWYRTLLKEQVGRLLPEWEAVTGLYSDSWQTKNMKTRWGTCNTRTRKIWLNLQLAQKPVGCLEYVILHELAHLKVPDHGKEFEALLDRYMPDWRERRRILNDRTII